MKKHFLSIVFVSYLKNKGVRRLCFILGVLLALMPASNFAFRHMFDDIKNILIAFYTPFIIACAIQWIYDGFKHKD